MTLQEIEQKISELGPWFYPFQFANGLRTTSSVPPDVTQIFDTRLEMVRHVVERQFGGRLPAIRCIDIGCHEGFYSIALAKMGVRSVTGVDVRESNLSKA